MNLNSWTVCVRQEKKIVSGDVDVFGLTKKNKKNYSVLRNKLRNEIFHSCWLVTPVSSIYYVLHLKLVTLYLCYI